MSPARHRRASAAAESLAGWRPGSGCLHCDLLQAKWNWVAGGGSQPHREALKGEIS